ncbi:hypothetical protein P4O66_020538 [Electrophorus voltai]|uniref:Caveolin n=1 Tax=Electrophorus voltai TaxID=2609070 RepID=A0AAD9E4V7_9TELE|nr:hypothetical protein P4O66_020538 [Electrophorus voltai]
MGIAKEKGETSILMHEDLFNRSIEPFLTNKEKLYTPLLDRDPNNLNAHLKVGFDDVIAEPSSTHSFDGVWICSHAGFELVKYVFYRLLTTILAVPLAFVGGIVFGVFSCMHIWVVMPLVRSFMMALASLQVIWASVTDLFLAPFFHSTGRCLSSITVKAAHN